MPQSLVKNTIHLTFSTKHRQTFIDNEIEGELYAYLGGICRKLFSTSITIGGHKDHVHILFLLSRKESLMDVVEKLKSHSSKWVKTRGEKYRNFYWQNGYGAFSVSPKEVEQVKNYIYNQEEHHKEVDFKQEFKKLLEDHEIPYDERYVWD